jgi:hypothetical protein
MNSSNINQLLSEIKQEVLLSPEEAQLVETIIADSIMLTSQMMAGVDVTSEMAILNATALNLAEAKRAAVEGKLKSFLFDIVHVAVMSVLA